MEDSEPGRITFRQGGRKKKMLLPLAIFFQIERRRGRLSVIPCPLFLRLGETSEVWFTRANTNKKPHFSRTSDQRSKTRSQGKGPERYYELRHSIYMHLDRAGYGIRSSTERGYCALKDVLLLSDRCRGESGCPDRWRRKRAFRQGQSPEAKER